ncbi:MAG: hypothetical protein OXT09_36915 [Myxococcales bacterium]|nr:hypothetical protein [Myxococcales bacterium]
MWRALVLALGIAVAAGCGDDSTADGADTTADGSADASAPATQDAGGGDDGDAPAEPATGDPSRLVGTFAVELVEANPSTGTEALSSMRGFVRDAPVNERTVWDEIDAAGDCVLEVPSFPFCDPDCGPGRACVAQDVCRDDPVAVDVGTVTVSGVHTAEGAMDFELTRVGPSYQPDRSIDLAYPPAPEGAEVEVQTGGGDFAPFTIGSHGIAPLSVNVEGSLMAEREQALSVTWEPPGPEGVSSMFALVDLSHHGGSKGRVLCELDDASGRLEIEASLVTALIDLGTAGWPTLKLTRRSVGSTVMELGRVDFSVEHGREIPLDIPGLISCTFSSECPEGESCLPTRKCG